MGSQISRTKFKLFAKMGHPTDHPCGSYLIQNMHQHNCLINYTEKPEKNPISLVSEAICDAEVAYQVFSESKYINI